MKAKCIEQYRTKNVNIHPPKKNKTKGFFSNISIKILILGTTEPTATLFLFSCRTMPPHNGELHSIATLIVLINKNTNHENLSRNTHRLSPQHSTLPISTCIYTKGCEQIKEKKSFSEHLTVSSQLGRP